MSNILIINAHHSYPFSKGTLNRKMVEIAEECLKAQGHSLRVVHTDQEWDVEKELENHQWADAILVQSPVNWMMVPWTFKKYMDEVYTAGMRGALCNGDGRHADNPKKNYGGGGTLKGKNYMISLTLNAPEEAFNDVSQYLFQGKSLDDLWMPMHMNFRFFAMSPLPTFACYDVMKNPDIGKDFERFKAHLRENF